ncbi:unnamed protein product [Prunus armeniaca]
MGKEKFLGVLRRFGWGSGFNRKAKRERAAILLLSSSQKIELSSAPTSSVTAQQPQFRW